MNLAAPLRTLLLGSTLLFASAAHAEDGDAILKRVDEAMNRAKDQFFAYDVIDKQPGKNERTLGLEVDLKGEKRLTKFTRPADVKGTRVLILSQTQMYIYLPAYKKVRRIASHVTNQGFMGTTYSNDDMALTTFADKYAAKLAKEAAESWTLELTAKAGGEAPYPKLVVEIGKKLNLPDKLDYYNGDGVLTKTELRTGYDCQGKICTAKEQQMTDHSANGHWTKLVRTEWKVDRGISDEVFSKRSLAK